MALSAPDICPVIWQAVRARERYTAPCCSSFSTLLQGFDPHEFLLFGHKLTFLVSFHFFFFFFFFFVNNFISLY